MLKAYIVGALTVVITITFLLWNPTSGKTEEKKDHVVMVQGVPVEELAGY
ncbi:MAG TPA: hypothetical protein VEA18_04025 [Candidatus Kapabacteria bacterium]|nr:hypothetical protein [Candidatus Kapabacteria bacterium]